MKNFLKQALMERSLENFLGKYQSTAKRCFESYSRVIGVKVVGVVNKSYLGRESAVTNRRNCQNVSFAIENNLLNIKTLSTSPIGFIPRFA